MNRSALTLVEILVTLAIAGVLTGLLLPAVQRVRASASRATCQNNFRQLGLAAHAYHADRGAFPNGVQGPGSVTPGLQPPALVSLLEFVGESPRLNQFVPSALVTEDANHAARAAGDVRLYLCPADPSPVVLTDASPADAVPGPAGRTNYYLNLGTHAWARESSGTARKPAKTAGMFAVEVVVRATDVTDGTSNTAMFAEVRRAWADTRYAVSRVLPADWAVVGSAAAGTSSKYVDPLQDMVFTGKCQSAVQVFNVTGLQYFQNAPYDVFYTHTLPPNYAGRDCSSFTPATIHLAARSHHVGGVGVCMADGSVRFVHEAVPSPVWRALGTRAGGETETIPD